MMVATTESEEQNSMYMCSCCKACLSKKEYPPVDGLCPECYNSRVETLRELYDQVERVLSFALQKPTTLATSRAPVDEVRTARDNLRAAMRKMGWKQQF